MMKKFKTLAIVFFMFMIAIFSNAQSIVIETNGANSTTMDLSSVESIVFDNNNLVFHTTDCGDNYFNVFLNKKLFFTENITAIENVDASIASITVYPNPANNSMTITKASDDVSEAFVYNVMGKMILALNLSGQNSTIDISMLPSGLYFLLIDNQSVKFIKQ